MCKVRGARWRSIDCENDPDFDSPVELYDFAVAILEGKPVFVGDDVYLKDGRKYDWNAVWMGQIIHHLTWNKPKKRTFTLAGYELPMPINDPTLKPWVEVLGKKYHFATGEDMNDFSLTVSCIIHEAIENARLQNK